MYVECANYMHNMRLEHTCVLWNRGIHPQCFLHYHVTILQVAASFVQTPLLGRSEK